MTFKELLNFFDFDYELKPDGYAFIDLQGAYLGDIDDERYYDAISMVERLVESSYGDDYLFSDEELNEYDCETVEEFIEKYGNDKSKVDGYTYYSLHPEELEELPPDLDAEKCEKIYDEALEKAEEVLKQRMADKYKDYPYMIDLGGDELDHAIQKMLFKSEEDAEKWLNGEFGIDNRDITIDVEDYMPKDVPMETLSKEPSKSKGKGEER